MEGCFMKTKHTGPIKLSKKPMPSLWASKIPFGLGKIKPHHIRDTAKVVWENKDNLPYATRILTQGVCDGCALVVQGLKSPTPSGPHVCATRLKVFRLNTMGRMNKGILHAHIEHLRKMSSTEPRNLGRIPYPLLRKPGDRRFSRLSWDVA